MCDQLCYQSDYGVPAGIGASAFPITLRMGDMEWHFGRPLARVPIALLQGEPHHVSQLVCRIRRARHGQWLQL